MEGGAMMHATPEMCVYCFDALHHYLHRTAEQPMANFPDQSFPLFVTWKIKSTRRFYQRSSGNEYSLRGCIGTFSAQNVHKGLFDYALTSALNDKRFSPISKDELPRLQCTVSLLIAFEKVPHYLDWEVGVHGIWIEFRDHDGTKYTATYLPEVAPEQGWTKERTIDSLMRKSGYDGPLTELVKASIQLTRYRSEKTSLTYDDYVKHKQRVRAPKGLGELVTVRA